MKVATWNVNGIRARMDQLAAWIATEKPDVLCLQESKASPDQLSDSSSSSPTKRELLVTRGKGGYFGRMSVHLRRSAFAEPPLFSHPPFDAETRIVVATVGDTLFASVYVPNGGKDYAAKITFLRELTAWVRATCAEGKNLVLCGDLNVAISDLDVHPSQRQDGIIGQRPEERAFFASMFEGGMVDVQRRLAPEDDRLFTWWPYWRQARERNIGWRIDYVLAHRGVAERATECAIRRDVGTSDHALLVATFP